MSTPVRQWIIKEIALVLLFEGGHEARYLQLSERCRGNILSCHWTPFGLRGEEFGSVRKPSGLKERRVRVGIESPRKRGPRV